MSVTSSKGLSYFNRLMLLLLNLVTFGINIILRGKRAKRRRTLPPAGGLLSFQFLPGHRHDAFKSIKNKHCWISQLCGQIFTFMNKGKYEMHFFNCYTATATLRIDIKMVTFFLKSQFVGKCCNVTSFCHLQIECLS